MAGRDRLEETIRALYGASVSISGQRAVGGGCINDTSVLALSDGSQLFLKENSSRFPDLFRAEAVGLQALSVEGGVRVPEVVATVEDGSRQFLLLEFISSGTPGKDFWTDFGRRLARIHLPTIQARFGFEVDNYIGATAQPNGWETDWVEFFGQKRLGFQADLALERGRIDHGLRRDVESIIGKLSAFLPRPDGASILHGDLWSGNYMVDSMGSAVLIDPAVYWGHREADIAMTQLFGGFSADFYSAYNEALPLEPGFEQRRDLYNLYHLLNHLNLFGGSYLASVKSIVARYR